MIFKADTPNSLFRKNIDLKENSVTADDGQFYFTFSFSSFIFRQTRATRFFFSLILVSS